MKAHYTQSCPTCGRRIQVRISLIGRTVACAHCHGEFRAAAQAVCEGKTTDIPLGSDSANDSSVPSEELMERVERMLAQTATFGG